MTEAALDSDARHLSLSLRAALVRTIPLLALREQRVALLKFKRQSRCLWSTLTVAARAHWATLCCKRFIDNAEIASLVVQGG